MSLRPFLTTYWSVPPGSRLLPLLLLVRLLGGGDLLRAVQQGAQRHPAEHVAMGLLDELHQLADVAVQTLGRRRETERGASESKCVRRRRSWDFGGCVKRCVGLCTCIYA